MRFPSKEYYTKKKNYLVNDETRWKQFQNACIIVLLGSTSLVMSVFNLFTDQGSFTWVTMGFSVACAINLILLKRKGTAAKVASFLFAAEVSTLFIYFIITGIPDGFSVLWTPMLPCFGLLMFGVRNGTIISVITFAVIAFFFWTPLGSELLLFDYHETFRMRFPILYLVFFVVAYLLEKMREAAYSALKESRLKYEFLCYHDALTGLYNRFWLQSILSDPEKYTVKPAAVAVLDIDNFKFFNDSFGHPSGDIVIKELGQLILDTLNGSGELCRWGGDEFLILFHTDIDSETVCRRIVDVVRAHEFILKGERRRTTVTVGLAIAPNGGTDHIEALIHRADANLYQAKDQGKNRTISSQLSA